MTTTAIDTARHPIDDPAYAERCRAELDATGALVLDRFFADHAIDEVVAEFTGREGEAFYAASTHNVYLTPPDPDLPD
ncbi:MAG: 2OG-Fe(II) oxygenase, partial [Actinomycetota bacterium]